QAKHWTPQRVLRDRPRPPSTVRPFLQRLAQRLSRSAYRAACSFAALRADTAHLNDDAPRMKASHTAGLANGLERGRCVHLGHALAIFANKGDDLRRAFVIGHAGKKRVAAFEPVNEPGSLQHIQNAIDRNWREALSILGQALDQIVGAHGLMAGCDLPENPLAKRRPFDAPFE